MAQISFIVSVEIYEDEIPSDDMLQDIMNEMEDVTNKRGLDLIDSEFIVEDC